MALTSYGALVNLIGQLKGGRNNMDAGLSALRAGAARLRQQEIVLAALRKASVPDVAAKAPLLEEARRGLLSTVNGVDQDAFTWLSNADAALAILKDPASRRSLEYAKDASWLTRSFMSSPLQTLVIRATPLLRDKRLLYGRVLAQTESMKKLSNEIDRETKVGLGTDWETRLKSSAASVTRAVTEPGRQALEVVTSGAGTVIKSAALPLTAIGIGAVALGLAYLFFMSAPAKKAVAGAG